MLVIAGRYPSRLHGCCFGSAGTQVLTVSSADQLPSETHISACTGSIPTETLWLSGGPNTHPSSTVVVLGECLSGSTDAFG